MPMSSGERYYIEAAFDRKPVFRPLLKVPARFLEGFREMSWPLFDSCMLNVRERQNDFGSESNFWDM